MNFTRKVTVKATGQELYNLSLDSAILYYNHFTGELYWLSSPNKALPSYMHVVAYPQNFYNKEFYNFNREDFLTESEYEFTFNLPYHVELTSEEFNK